jgi:uncharacterized protein with HEPN domain
MTRHDDLLYYGHMLDAARHARRLVADMERDHFDQDETLQLALTRLIQNLGEAARNVSVAGRTALPSIPWPHIVAMRNRLVHAYWKVDLDVVWEAATEDLPTLITALETVVPSEPPEAPDPSSTDGR